MAKFEGIVTKVQSVGTEYDWITFKFSTPPGFQGGITLFKLTEAIPPLPRPLVERTAMAERKKSLGFAIGEKVEVLSEAIVFR